MASKTFAIKQIVRKTFEAILRKRKPHNMFMVIGKIKEENDFHGPFSEMNELWFGVRNRRWFHGLFLMSKLL